MIFAVFDPSLLILRINCSLLHLYYVCLLFWYQLWVCYLFTLYMIIRQMFFFGKWTRGIRRVNQSVSVT